jgi:hypothetical protein
MAKTDHNLLQQPVGTIHAIASILAHGVVRLLQRQNALDNQLKQSVHDHPLVTKGETL